MAGAGDSRLDQIAKAISLGGSVDWDLELAAAPDSLRPALERLRQLHLLNRAFRSLATLHAESARSDDRSKATARSPEPSDRDAALFQWGHLEVRAHLGQGSFGDVYLAIDTQLDRKVALKLWRRDSLTSGTSARRFLDEARRLARVCHPNVVVVHGAGVHRRRPGFWTELIQGETLASRLRTRGNFDVEEATRIGLDLSRALAAVHAAGLVHGDVKLENVMWAEDGRIVLMDFGAASRLDTASDDAGVSFLTPCSAAPEALAGEVPHPTADIYSLGVLLYRLVSGTYPISAENMAELREKHCRGESKPLRDLRPDLPLPFLRVVERALEVEATHRFQSAGELEGTLRAVLRSVRPAALGDTAQSLRSLKSELGRVPEQLCLRIAQEVASGLNALHDAGDVHGRLGLDTVHLLSDGRVAVGPAEIQRSAATARDDLSALGRLLSELSTGESAPSDTLPRVAGELDSEPSSFFEEIVEHLSRSNAETKLSAAELARVLVEGERSSWWQSRVRSQRPKTKPLRRMRIPREVALHGRATELDQLAAAFHLAQTGAGQVILVIGEAGIGKSRLIDELVGRLEHENADVQFLFGSYPPGGAATAASAFTDAYREHFDTENLAQTLGAYFRDSPLLAAALGSLLEGHPFGTDRLARETVQTGFVHLTGALSAERPTILLIDDLHFASEEGRSLFAALASAAPRQRLLLVGTARPELPEAWTASLARLDHVAVLSASRLSSHHVADLLGELFDTPSLPASFVDELAARSDGNPYFLLELIRSFKAGMSRDPGSAGVTANSLREVSIPFSIEQLVAARMAALEIEEDRELLDVACCAGFRFDPILVAEATRMEPVRALRRFGRIEARQGLVRAAGPDYAFDHHQLQEFLYLALADPLKQHYHSVLAGALRARVDLSGLDLSEVDGETVVSICDHELRGREPARALPLLREALAYLESHYANAAAIALIGRALEVPELILGSLRADLILRRGNRLAFVGRRQEAKASFEDAYAFIDPELEPALAAEIDRNLGVQHHLDGQFDRAVSLLERSVKCSQVAGDVGGESAARRELGTVLFHNGQHAKAESQFTQAITLARLAGSSQHVSVAQSYLGDLLVEMGRFEEAEGPIREAVAEARALGNIAAELSPLATLGSMLLELGRFDEAFQPFERLLDLSHRVGSRSGESLAWTNLGSLLPALGRYEEARTALEQVVRIAPEIRARDHEVSALCNLGFLSGLRGDHNGALTKFAAAEALRIEFGFVWIHGELLTCRGAVEELYGDLDRAEEFFRESLRVWTEGDNRPGTAKALVHLGRVAATRHQLGVWSAEPAQPFRSVVAPGGRESSKPLDRDAESEHRGIEEARAHLYEARRIAEESSALPETVCASIELGLLLAEELPEALARFERDETRLTHWERMRARFRFYLATGDRSHLCVAKRRLLDLIGDLPENDRQRAIEVVPLYRAIHTAENPIDGSPPL